MGEYLIRTNFQVHIKDAGKWYSWVVELESNQKVIVGAQEIPLSYVIRENDAPGQTERDTSEEKAVFAVPLTRIIYKQDNLTAHNIIFRNIADTLDAFTDVKPYIKKDNGRA